MNTKVVDFSGQIDKDLLAEASNIIKNGGLVAFPTETVYGLGGDALNKESSKKIYAAKGRPSDNPLIVHIASIDKLDAIVKSVPPVFYELADKFWPGPLTMIFNKSDKVPYETTGGLDTVAVRMPDNDIARAFIEAAGGYIAAPSANKSGRPSPTVCKYVVEDLDGLVEMIIDGGESVIGLESTIVDLTVEPPMILRPGYITSKDIDECVGRVSVDKTILDADSKEAPKAPGMKYRHYAPKAQMLIVSGETDNVVDFINSEITECSKKGLKTGVFASSETSERYKADSVKSLGSRSDEKEIARNLFRMLREFDDEGIQMIYSENFDGDGIAKATMNRMIKASGHKEVKV